jgi:hypothetical protein
VVKGRILIAAVAFSAFLRGGVEPSAEEIVRLSVQTNERDWQAEPGFTFDDREVTNKGERETDETHAVVMLDGSPYNRLIAVNGQPLSDEQQRQEMAKQQRELKRRCAESAAARRERIARYREERAHEHQLMAQMTIALEFTLSGEETIDGHRAYVLTATPKPGYRPIDRESKVLTGMQGKLWVDEEQYHWIKVEAEVIHSVSFLGFLARVEPGTRFELEKAPIDGLWLPKRFEESVAASVLLWQKRSTTIDTFTNYHGDSGLQPQTSAGFHVHLQAQEIEQVAQGHDR